MSPAQRSVVVVLVLLMLAAVTVLGCLVGTNDAEASAATANTAATPGTADKLSSLEDGRHPVLLTGIDEAGGTVEFDAVRLVGNRMENDNPTLRSLPVEGDVPKIATKAVCWLTVEDRSITRIEPAGPAGPAQLAAPTQPAATTQPRVPS
jgi:hypothetical protein